MNNHALKVQVLSISEHLDSVNCALHQINAFAAEILKVNDDVVKVMTQYKKVVEGKTEENGLDTLADPDAKPAVPGRPNPSECTPFSLPGGGDQSDHCFFYVSSFATRSFRN